MNTKSLIKGLYDTLTKTEKQIADFILEDESNAIISMTIAELSNRLKIGEASIIRFCRKINYKGFHDLKFAIALDEAKSEKEKSVSNYLDLIEKNMCETIHKTRAVVDQDKITLTVENIAKAHNVYFYGAGSSGFVAEIAEERFMRLGKTTKSIKENHMQLAQSAICGKNDLIIAITLSGATLDLYDALKVAKMNGTKIISITDHNDSPIARLSSVCLSTCGKENPISGGTLVSMTSQIYVLDLLCTRYAILHPHKTMGYKEKVAQSLKVKYNQAK